MQVTDPEYQSHRVFSELDGFIEFYSSLARSVFQWVSQGVQGSLGNIDSYVFSSIEGTLTSVRLVLKDGRINDAYALLRKYHDSAVINIYSNVYLEDEFGIENLVVKQIDDWVKGRKPLPEYRVMSQYIRSSAKVSVMNSIFFADDRYKRIRERCNGHTHYNYYQFVLLNDNEVLAPGRERELAQLALDVRDLFIFHIAYLFLIKQNYMMSSDYVDSLECGMQPEEESQYWVAPFVQQIFDDVVTKHRADVVTALKSATSMHLV